MHACLAGLGYMKTMMTTGWRCCDSITVLFRLASESLTASQHHHVTQTGTWAPYCQPGLRGHVSGTLNAKNCDESHTCTNRWIISSHCGNAFLLVHGKMTHFHSSLTSGTLKCGVNLFPSWLSLNLYWCLAFWNFRAGWRKVGHISPDMFQAVWGRGTHLQQAVKWNIGRKQWSLSKWVSPAPFHLHFIHDPNAKVPDEFPSGHGQLGFYCLRSFLRQFAILVVTVARHSFPWLSALSFR